MDFVNVWHVVTWIYDKSAVELFREDSRECLDFRHLCDAWRHSVVSYTVRKFVLNLIYFLNSPLKLLC